MGTFVHVEAAQVRSGMQRFRQLVESDEEWQELNRLMLEPMEDAAERGEVEAPSFDPAEDEGGD